MPVCQSALRRSMRLAVIDVVFYALMVGFGELYFVAAAVRLQASALEQGLIVTLPLCLGTLGPLLLVYVVPNTVCRKPIVVTAVLVQAVFLATMAFFISRDQISLWGLLACVCAYQLAGQVATNAWNTWYGTLIPSKVRGVYFAGRNRIAHLVTCGSLIAAGYLLQQTQEVHHEAMVIFGINFAIASAARLVSVFLLAATPAPMQMQERADRISLREVISGSESTPIVRFLWIAMGVQTTVYLASPYFNPFQLETLHFTYLQYTITSVAVVLFKFLTLPAWGRAVDRHGARSVYLLALPIIAIVPIPWLWATGLGWAVVSQCISGFGWGGHELAQLTLVLETTKPRVRAHVFAALNLVNGGSQLLGGLLGAALISSFSGSYRSVFAISIGLRLVMVAVAANALPIWSRGRNPSRRVVMSTMLGLRPSGVEARMIVSALEPAPENCEQNASDATNR